jgi:hypothetical protein
VQGHRQAADQNVIDLGAGQGGKKIVHAHGRSVPSLGFPRYFQRVPAKANPEALNDWYHSGQSQAAILFPRDTHCAAIPVIAHEEPS